MRPWLPTWGWSWERPTGPEGKDELGKWREVWTMTQSTLAGRIMALLSQVGKKRRICARSKRWWDDEIREARTRLQEIKRARGPLLFREARKRWFHLLRKKKRTM